MTTKLKVLLEGDPALRVVCEPVKEVTSELMGLAFNMSATMVAAGGIGLAAPQVGRNIRLLIMDTSYVTGYKGPSAIMFNPEIMHGEGNACIEEMCLSIPGKKVKVNRYAKVKVKYINIQNAAVIREFSGLAAIVIQHEMDHLDGIILSDHEKENV